VQRSAKSQIVLTCVAILPSSNRCRLCLEGSRRYCGVHNTSNLAMSKANGSLEWATVGIHRRGCGHHRSGESCDWCKDTPLMLPANFAN
jgi:hypothetical protein